MNTGIFGEGFPYSNFHDLNMDWIIKIAKDFLDQYTHIQELIDQGKTEITNLTEEELQELQDKYDTLEELLQEWYNTHSQDIANQLAQAITNFNTAATQKAAEAIASIPSDYTAIQTDVVNEGIANTLQISISSNIANWHFESDITGVYIKLPSNWYIRSGKSDTFAYDNILTNNRATSPSGVTGCILLPLNKMIAYNISDRTLDLVDFQTYPYNTKYVPIFICSIVPEYGASSCAITGGIGRYLFDQWMEFNNLHRIGRNTAFDNAVFYVRANARTNMYIEPWIDGVYIYLNGIWYIRNIFDNNKAYEDVLPSNRYTSHYGKENCIKLEAYKSLVFDITDSTYKIVDFSNYNANAEPIPEKYIQIFNTALLPFDGATLVDIVGGHGLGVYMKYLHYQQKVDNESIYIRMNDDMAIPHHFNNILLRNDGQDIAVYNNVIFSCNDDECTVDGVTFSMTNGHANAVTFGDTLHGDFPYLYCSDFYSNKIYVNQVTETSSALVDTINLEYAQYISNYAVDEANGIIYGLIATSNNPDDTSDVYFCKYDMTGHRISAKNLGSLPTMQGMTYFDGKIYLLSGYGTNNGGKLTIFDTTGEVIGYNALPFSNRLKNSEPQGISIDKVTGVLYLATRDYIMY